MPGIWFVGGRREVRRLREFNIALLGKWCWKMLDDREGLWYRVLVARYGEEGGCVMAGGGGGSSWWRDIGRIHDGVGFDGSSWFAENVCKTFCGIVQHCAKQIIKHAASKIKQA